MKPPKQGLEAIAVRRANLTDADKVRYRVYSSPTEFVAVIAESALMAVRISEIKKPYKIMRDLPTDGIAIEAKRMATHVEGAEKVSFSLKQGEGKTGSFTAEMGEVGAIKSQPFTPLSIADLKGKGNMQARIIPPSFVNEIIEEHVKHVAEEKAHHAAPALAVAEPQSEPAPIAPPEPTMTQEERVTQLADEVLPPAGSAPTQPAAAKEEVVLSPDEVEKLLNG